METDVATIRAFRDEDAAAFAALNRRWIEKHFGLEPSDLAQLEDPHRSIIDKGGFIAVAEVDGNVVGTGAILPAHFQPEGTSGWMEVVKMATDPAAQGKGVGGAVLTRLIAFARDRGAPGVWLETNAKLEAATALYRKQGFRRLAEDELWPTPYERCNLQMVLDL